MAGFTPNASLDNSPKRKRGFCLSLADASGYDASGYDASGYDILQENPPVAERFELYVSGIELANGYHEVLDSAELRRRTTEANAQRRADGKAELPEQNRLLAAMESESGLPPSTGVALGFDRVVMLATGASSIDEVITFPFDRA